MLIELRKALLLLMQRGMLIKGTWGENCDRDIKRSAFLFGEGGGSSKGLRDPQVEADEQTQWVNLMERGYQVIVERKRLSKTSNHLRGKRKIRALLPQKYSTSREK